MGNYSRSRQHLEDVRYLLDSGLDEKIGKNNICYNIDSLINYTLLSMFPEMAQENASQEREIKRLNTKSVKDIPKHADEIKMGVIDPKFFWFSHPNHPDWEKVGSQAK